MNDVIRQPSSIVNTPSEMLSRIDSVKTSDSGLSTCGVLVRRLFIPW